MKDKKLEKEELFSLNSEFTEFNLQELEQRLETDPLAIGGLLDFTSSQGELEVSMLGDDECNCSWLSHNK
jgi:hypothetical protein